MASRKELLDSISPDMKLNKAFFMKVYGYELTYPGFAENVLARLKFLGCSRAREYYSHFVSEYEEEYNRQMKNVAEWHLKKCREEFEEKKRKVVNKSRKQQEMGQWKKELLLKKRQLLMKKLQK